MTPASSARLLVVCDVDSTLIVNEVIELLAAQAGSLEEVAAVTERAMRGELDFAQSLHARVATLAGLPVSALETAREHITVSPGVAEFIEAVHETGGLIGAVSGGFSQILDPLAAVLGLDLWRANDLEVENGQLTGRVTGEVVDAQVKSDMLLTWAEDHGISPENTVAVGDGANDLIMMRTAGVSVAFNGKPIVRDYADIVLDIPDMRFLIPALGLTAS
jgi:phosphoserine phosphatase